jgi:hypothetical protein
MVAVASTLSRVSFLLQSYLLPLLLYLFCVLNLSLIHSCSNFCLPSSVPRSFGNSIGRANQSRFLRVYVGTCLLALSSSTSLYIWYTVYILNISVTFSVFRRLILQGLSSFVMTLRLSHCHIYLSLFIRAVSAYIRSSSGIYVFLAS